MGNTVYTTFIGHGVTPDAACADLQRQLPAKSLVSISSPDELHVKVLSPRSVARRALATVDGKDYEVSLTRVSPNNFSATVEIKIKR